MAFDGHKRVTQMVPLYSEDHNAWGVFWICNQTLN